MIRFFLLFLLILPLVARASAPIAAPFAHAGATVAQPHVTAELIPESTMIKVGQPFALVLHLHSDPGWHTYWVNPGDAGLATKIQWTLPGGFTAGPIQWPVPEQHIMGGIMTFGYAGDVYLLTTITPPSVAAAWPRHQEIKARATWLVCQEECIPGKADLSLTFDTATPDAVMPSDNKTFFDQVRARLPMPNTRWDVRAAYGNGGGTVDAPKPALWIQFSTKPGVATDPLGNLYFFPEQSNVLAAKETDNGLPDPSKQMTTFELPLSLQQNGEKAAQVSGVLVSDRPLIGNSKAVYLSSFATDAKDVPMVITRDGVNLMASGLETFSPPDSAPSATAASGGHGPPLQTATAAQPYLIVILMAAFVGGLILNLMPCVLPVLSLKVFSLVKHAGDDPRGAWKQGVAFTLGVVVSFWMLAGLLLLLRALGHQFGWGFQMQSPGFILGMIFLFFLLALNLFGVFEIGTSLVGLDARAAGRTHGLTSSFLNGALATLAATPCTGPLMGSTLGFAAQQPAAVAMIIFTFLALGLASPYLLLTIFPGALRYVPKPGAWMEAFRQFMGFLLMAAVIWFIHVFGALVGDDRVAWLLLALLLAGMAAWIYGLRVASDQPLLRRIVPILFLLVFLGASLNLGLFLALAPIEKKTTAAGPDAEGYQAWSDAAVAQALAQKRPVFVDFTAAWCLSCKVNEKVALETDAVRQAFTQKNVALFRADWTQADPAISETLQRYQRDGVPLYLLYSPKNKETPQVLPEVLTPGIVLAALDRL